jgi:hypothetical protein
MGVGYQYEEGIIKHETLKKFTLVLNDELKISKALKIGFDINAYKGLNPQTHDFGNAIVATPVVEPFNEAHGLYNQMPIGTAQIGNPLRAVEETQGQFISNTYRAVGSVFFEAAFLRNFTFRTTLYGDLGFTDEQAYTPLVNTLTLPITILHMKLPRQMSGRQILKTQNTNKIIFLRTRTSSAIMV